MKLLFILLTVWAGSTNLSTGVYIYVNTATNHAISGVPEDGKMTRMNASVYDENQQYYIAFNATGDSATVQHVKTGSYIGYKNNKLDVRESKWAVYQNDTYAALYMSYGTKTYILWPNVLDSYGHEFAALYEVNDVTNTTTALLPVSTSAVEPVDSPSANETKLRIGIVELIIRNGKKLLNIQ